MSGAISGARNPEGKKAKEHARRYYGLVRSMKNDVIKIAKTTGIEEQEIKEVKDYIFISKHELEGGYNRFEPDYMMAESWQRLIEGRPETHDVTMIKHELLEMKMVKQGKSQKDAHILASKEYNYSKEAIEYYGRVKKYKKD